MKRILVVVPNDSLGGAEQYLKMIAEFYDKDEYLIDVYFLKKTITGAWNELESERFKLHFTNYTKEKFGVLSLLKNLLTNRKKNYEYVFTSHIHLNSLIALLRKLQLVKADHHIARESTSIFERFKGVRLFVFKMHYKFNYNKIDLLICQTDFMSNQLRKAMPQLFDRIKVRTIPNPVNLNKLILMESEQDVPFSNFIVSAGRLISEKGFDILIEAFRELYNDFPGIKLVILGEGQLRVDLENRINELGLNDQIYLPGFVDNVYPYFNQAELCVVSSRIEGFPNVLLQMMSQNDKVVSTLCAGGIKNIQGIEVAETHDVDSLYRSMRKSLENDTSVNRRLFDEELRSRSIDSFIKRVENELQQSH